MIHSLPNKGVEDRSGRLDAQDPFALLKDRLHSPRIAAPDFIAFLVECVHELLRAVAADQTAPVHQADAIAALRLIQINGSNEYRHSLFHELMKHDPEVAA